MVRDVAVVGAGLSGLICAHELVECGLDVVVLEARDRVGGRTYSTVLGDGTFDLGGQWLGPGQHRVQKLARELGVETFPTYSTGRNVLVNRGRRIAYRGTIPRISPFGLAGLGWSILRATNLARRVSATAPWSVGDADILDGRTVEAIAGLSNDDARAAFDAAIRTVFGAEASELSLLHFGWYTGAGEGFFNLVEVRGGAQERRFVAGAQSLSLELAALVGPERIVFDAPVEAVTQTDETVELRTDGHTFEARRVVFAMAPPMLRTIEFKPALPPQRVALIEGAEMGSAIKVHALFDTPFWRTAGLSGEGVFGDPPLSVVFDNGSHDGAQPALVGFIVGDNARVWSQRSAVDRRDAVLDSLVRAFGEQARSPTLYYEHDWNADPYSGGCPVAFLGPGVLTKCGPAIREPVGRIHWAGTETATHYPGYLEGAIEAGGRAAAEVMSRSGPTKPH